MIIRDANIQLHASHQWRTRYEERESITINRGSAPSEAPEPAGRPVIAPNNAAVSLSVASAEPQVIDLRQSMSAQDRLQMAIVARLYQQITGKELQIMALPEPTEQMPKVEVIGPVRPVIPQATLTYERTTRFEEAEKMHFAAKGEVTTQDGKRIDFSAALRMDRHYVEETTERLVMGNAVMTDPLVINFDGPAAALTNAFFEFDLDADGTPEQIANLRATSGYLALDKNGDGIINNGNELFGPQTNNGFAELARYDDDGNGFIDEGDAIYDQLRIWQRTESGENKLIALGDKNIGAIYLGHTQTPFQLNDDNNASLGEVVSSGIFLREDGTSGTVQQINLAV